MSADSTRDMVIFTEALGLPAEALPAFLDGACAGDDNLHRKVEALLRAHDRVGGFLESPPTGMPVEDIHGTPTIEKPGDRIGRYKLLQQIGEGGWGIVFMAEQEQPIHRRVALKIVKPGMDTKSVIARFEAERQALALMDHPGIAKIFDAGATESGRPYFVMELVRGIKITEYCDQHSLTTEERLNLFVQVCHAVQHAHQKGIIHRDIKPSNILVTTDEEGARLPVVIDFGIAKVTTNQRLTDKTLFTALEMLIGTPAYMSPEQAELSSAGIDTRTDIYSLGVLLYELLTGSTPFDTGALLKAGVDEIRRVIREQEPARPSTRLSSLTHADITTVAQRRHSAPPTLIHAVSGDLDWITMKALEKDRTRRYETATGLALDIERYLANEPIRARPPSTLYKFRKVVLRNKLLFAAIGVIVTLTFASLVMVSVSLAKERQMRRQLAAALRESKTDEAKATTEAIRSQEANQFLKDMLAGVGPSARHGADVTLLREILDRTAKRVGVLTNQPSVEAELRDEIGRLYADIGSYDQAEPMLRSAVALDRDVFSPQSAQTAVALNDLGRALSLRGNLDEAERANAEALDIRQKLFGHENALVAESIDHLASVRRHQHRLAEADKSIREALGIRERLFGADSAEVAESLHNLSVVLGDEGKPVEGEAVAQRILAIRQRLNNDDPSLGSALADAAWAAGLNKNLDKSESLYQEALSVRRKAFGDDHPDVAKTLYSLGEIMRQRGNLTAADGVMTAAVSIQTKILGDGHPDTLYSLNNLAKIFEEEGKWVEAEILYRNVLPLWRKLRGIDDPVSMYTLRKLGSALEAEHKWPEAESIDREALSISSKKGDQDADALADLDKLARVLTNEKEYAEANELLDKALTPTFVTQGASASLLAQRINLFGHRGRWKEAAAVAALALENQPDDHYRYHVLAGLLVMTGDRPAYEQLCKKIITRFRNPSNNPYIAERVVQDCLLLPNSGADLALIDKLADAAVTLGSGDAALPYFQACKAMSNYRLGRFSEAVEWAEKAVNSATAEAPAKGKAFAVLAMARWQLRQEQAARAALADGDAASPEFSQEHEDLGESWMAWLMARISLDEAAALIQPRPALRSQSNQP